MANVPPFLGEFDDEDARWLSRHGERRDVVAGDVIISEGRTPAHIFVVLDGEFVVSSRSLGDADMQRIRAGELLGEISYIQKTPPGASVIAAKDGVVLAIPRSEVDQRLAEDPHFAARFQRVISELAVDRLWQYGRRALQPRPQRSVPDDDLRVHELIEKLLRGEF